MQSEINIIEQKVETIENMKNSYQKIVLKEELEFLKMVYTQVRESNNDNSTR